MPRLWSPWQTMKAGTPDVFLAPPLSRCVLQRWKAVSSLGLLGPWVARKKGRMMLACLSVALSLPPALPSGPSHLGNSTVPRHPPSLGEPRDPYQQALSHSQKPGPWDLGAHPPPPGTRQRSVLAPTQCGLVLAPPDPTLVPCRTSWRPLESLYPCFC